MTKETTAIASRLLQLRGEKQKIAEEEDTLWTRFFEICDDIAGEDQSHTVLVLDENNSIIISREMHQATDKVLIDDLKKDLDERQWKTITIQTRVLDMDLLTTALGKGEIPIELVSKHTEHKPPVPHKKLRLATEKDISENE